MVGIFGCRLAAHSQIESAEGRKMDLDCLNSATKYPSILTYHGLGERGRLTEEVATFPDMAILTEKVDGTNGRIILPPGDDYFIGSREELLYDSGCAAHPSGL